MIRRGRTKANAKSNDNVTLNSRRNSRVNKQQRRNAAVQLIRLILHNNRRRYINLNHNYNGHLHEGQLVGIDRNFENATADAIDNVVATNTDYKIYDSDNRTELTLLHNLYGCRKVRHNKRRTRTKRIMSNVLMQRFLKRHLANLFNKRLMVECRRNDNSNQVSQVISNVRSTIRQLTTEGNR